MHAFTQSTGSGYSCVARIGFALCLLIGLPRVALAHSDFIRADSNSDDHVDISDALFTLGFLFLGGPAPACDDAADANDDGAIDISDASYILGYLFLGAREPPAPGANAPGPDPTTDGLTCGVELRCDSPTDGSHVDLIPGAGVLVRGTAIGLVDVRVNGALVGVAADQTFSATIDGRQGINFVELSGTDARGAMHTSLCAFIASERWLAEGDPFDEALLFRVEPPGFNKLNSAIPGWFHGQLSQNLNSSFLAANPFFESDCGLGSCITELQFLSLSVAPNLVVTVSILNQNSLNVAVQLDLDIHLRARSKLSGISRPSIEGDLKFRRLKAGITVSLGIDPASGLPRAAAQSISPLTADEVSPQFPGLDRELIDLLVLIVQENMALSLTTELATGAAGLYQGLLAGADVTLPAAGFPAGRLDGTGDVTVALGARWTLALNKNGLTLGAGLRVTSPEPGVGGRIPLTVGLDLWSEPARPGVDAWSAAHVGVLNLVLHGLWRARLFDGIVAGGALGPGLPEGTSLAVTLRAMPVVTGFDPAGAADLDVGALEVVVTHPGLPPGLRVIAGARLRARASLVALDLVFDEIATRELHFSTGKTSLDEEAQAILRDLLERLLVKLTDIALNESLPVLPVIDVTVPPDLSDYGLAAGSLLGGDPRLVLEPDHAFLEAIVVGKP